KDQDRVKRLREHLLPGRELLIDAVLARACGADILGHVAERGDLESVAQLSQVMQVHDLGDQAASDDPNPQASGQPQPSGAIDWNVPRNLYERGRSVNTRLAG